MDVWTRGGTHVAPSCHCEHWAGARWSVWVELDIKPGGWKPSVSRTTGLGRRLGASTYWSHWSLCPKEEAVSERAGLPAAVVGRRTPSLTVFRSEGRSLWKDGISGKASVLMPRGPNAGWKSTGEGGAVERAPIGKGGCSANEDAVGSQLEQSRWHGVVVGLSEPKKQAVQVRQRRLRRNIF